MIFTFLNEDEFNNFVNKSDTNNFFQSIYMKHRFEKEGKKTFLIGVKKNKQIIAACLIVGTERHFLGKIIYEAYKGFIMDYANQELLEFITKNVIKFLKKHNGLELIIDPYIPNISRDMNANIISGIDNRFIKNNLYKLGYKDNDGFQVKWCYCLDLKNLTREEVFASFRSSTKNNINKTLTKYNLVIKQLAKEELSTFKKITNDTCLRRGFKDKSLEYYENMYESFKDKIKFLVCYLDCDKYLNNLKKSIKINRIKLAELSNSSSNHQKKKIIQDDLENAELKINEICKIKKEKCNLIPISGAMFILYGKEIVYLFSGSYKEYMNFYGQYAIQWEIIKYAIDNKYERYNFYGINDVFNPNGKDRGVYEFKKGFGGYVEELIGSFKISICYRDILYTYLKKMLKR